MALRPMQDSGSDRSPSTFVETTVIQCICVNFHCLLLLLSVALFVLLFCVHLFLGIMPERHLQHSATPPEPVYHAGFSLNARSQACDRALTDEVIARYMLTRPASVQ